MVRKQTQKIQEDNTNRLLKQQGVKGTAVGEKWVDGKPTGQEAILIFVQKKFSARSIISPNMLTKFTADDLIPEKINGIPTDVIEVGNIVKQSFQNKMRPIKPGYSVGHGKITAGTIGGIFNDKDGDPVILSNNHVLANENNANIGDLIYQPGPADSNQNQNDVGWQEPIAGLPYVGTLKKFMKINKTGNLHDSAVAKIHPSVVNSGLVDDTYPQIGSRLTGFGDPTIGMQVQKCGRTTGYTTGRVLGINASFTIGYDFGSARFDQCVVLTTMSKGGDSVGEETSLYYKVNGQLRYNTIGQMYEELEVEEWLDNERFVPKDTIEVLSTTGLRVYRIAGHKRNRKEQHDVIWRKVNWLYKHWTDKRLFKVWTRDHREITVTEDHSLFGGDKMRPDGLFPEITGNSIKIGTQLLVPSTLQAIGDITCEKLDDEMLIAIGLFLGDGSFERNNSRISISSGGNETILTFFQQYISNTSRFSSPSHIAIAEHQNNERFNRKEFATQHGITTSAIAHSVRRFKNGEFKKPKICYMKKNGDITISNTKFAKEMLSFGLHNGFATKSIPSLFMTSSLNNIRQLLKGLFSSDGGIKFKKNSLTIAFGVHNKILAEQCRTLLWRCGIRCAISHENAERSGYKASCSKLYRVVIAAVSDVKKFMNEIGLIGHDARTKRANKMLEKLTGIAQYPLTSKSVKGIEEQFIKQPVYDLSVEGERFIANGFVCHNSGSIIQDMSEQAVALLFAGSDKVTIASPINIVRDYYGLNLYTDAPNKGQKTVKFSGLDWVVRSSDPDEIKATNDAVKFIAASNNVACIELPISTLKMVRCTVNTGTDKGATWAAGLSVHWPNGYIKLNLRHGGTFGGYVNGSSNINIGKTKVGKDYMLRIRNTGTTYIGEIKDDAQWFTVVEVPKKMFPYPPTMIRLGKTDLNANVINHTIAGDIGESVIKEFINS